MSVIKKRTRNIKTVNQPRSKDAVAKKMANRPCDEKRVKKTASQPRNQKGVKNNRTKRMCPPPYDKNMTYQPERIVGKCRLRGRLYYAVKWVGYDDDNNTWEPAWNMASFSEMIADFEVREKEARKAARKNRARLRYHENEQPSSKPPKQLLSPSATKNGLRSNGDVDPPESDGLHQYQMHVSGSDGEFESSERELLESPKLMRAERAQAAAQRELDHFDTPKNSQRSRNLQLESTWSPSPIENHIHCAWSNREQYLSNSSFHIHDDSLLYQHEDYVEESRKTRKPPRKRSSLGYPKNEERLWDTLQSVFSPSAIQNDAGLELEEDLSDCYLDENDNQLLQYANDSSGRSWTLKKNVKRRRSSRSDQTMSELEDLEEVVEQIVGGTVTVDGEMYFIIKLKNQQMHVLRNDQARKCISRHLIEFYERYTEWL